MELASRTFSKQRLNGLSRCIENKTQLDFRQRTTCKAVKERGCTSKSSQARSMLHLNENIYRQSV